MKYCLFLIAIVLNLSLLAQEHFTPVDRDKVKKAVTDDKAPTAYKELLHRYNAFDSTLTLEDYRLLYYGFVFQKGFGAHMEENKKEVNQALNDKDYKKASDICDGVLSRNPVSLSANYYKGLSLFEADQGKMDYIPYRDRFKHLVEAILSSGDGLTCETGIRVISIPDEYTILYNYFNIEECKGQALVSHCDRMTVKPSGTWSKELLYFDATEILKKEEELFGH
jgi:hypothetical protein